MPLSSEPRIDIDRVLNPRTVAIFGASDDKGKFGGRITQYIRKHGYQGRTILINPRRKDVLGQACYARIGEAPVPADVAILAVPRHALVDSVRECAAAGVGCCVILTIGFAESGSEDGSRMQEELVAISRDSGMRLLGPNCLGLINPHHHLALTSSITMEVPELIQGEVGLISQSGALLVSMHNRATASGIGFSACVSLGNQADLEICDFLEYMVADPRTKVICLYVEGFKDAARFLHAAEAAAEAGKPVLMVKAGRTSAGVRAASSHTASLAGSYEVLEAACRERGVVLTDDPEAMVYGADILARWGVGSDDGLGVISPSGGSVSICSDRVGEAGLRLAELGADTRRRLEELLIPPQVANPIDLGGRRDSDVILSARRTIDVLASDPAVNGLLLVLSTTPFFSEVGRQLGEGALASGKPVVAIVTPGSAGDGVRQVLTELGCPWYERLDDGLRVLRIWSESGRLARRPRRDAGRRPAMKGFPDLSSGRLDGVAAKELVRLAGIPVNEGELAPDGETAVSIAARLGYPVAVKALSDAIVHKSDVGAVMLSLPDAEAVRTAFAQVIANASGTADAGVIDTCVVEEMVSGDAELLVGIRHDEQFGPVVAVGTGGVLAELLRDVSFALAPIGVDAAVDLLEQLRSWPLLNGYRGSPRLDIEAAAEAVSRMSWLACDLGWRLDDLEINPLILKREGEGVVAVDARGHLKGRT